MSVPLTYTARARISGLSASGPSRWGLHGPVIEVELSREAYAPITINGTLAFNTPPADLPVGDTESLLGALIEVTVRLMVKKVRVVAWTAAEVPLGAWVRTTQYPTDHYLLVAASQTTLMLADRTEWEYQMATTNLEYSTDGGKTWKAAGRVEEVYE